MINPKELQIGNLLHWEADHLGAGTSRVTLIKEDGYEIESLCGCYPLDDEMEHIEPIPLTPEWLEQCGFKWDKGFMKIDMKHARMSLGFYAGVSDKMSLFQTSTRGEGSIEMEFGFGSNHPEYLHQLQNLYLALTGEELTINV